MKKKLFLLCLLGIAITAYAHEYVMLAYKYHVEKGDLLEIHLFVADGFNIQLERPFKKSITKKFELLTSSKSIDLLKDKVDGSLPIANVKVDFEGLGLLHMERDYARNTLSTDKFISYLKEDHLENITVKNNPAKVTQTERYTRYLKALVQSGKNQKDTLYKTITGQKFEIILLQNPYILHKGDLLSAKLLFNGKPLVNKIVTARNRKGNEAAIALLSRTNKDGICYFKLKRDGEWFLHVTHIIVSGDLSDSDWESFWASYSFAVD